VKPRIEALYAVRKDEQPFLWAALLLLLRG
jgi:hypothetical protein